MIPVHNYFTSYNHTAEQGILFKRSPKYFGHELMIPNAGDYRTLDWMGHGKMLRNIDGQMKLISNVCRHRQALIYQGSGNGNHMTCNLHGWTYDQEGQLIGAPHFPETPCLNLGQVELHNWNGMLFDRDVGSILNNMKLLKHFDFTGYKFHSSVNTEYDFNWKTFIEVYSEDYHVDPFHPGLGKFVDCADLKWEFGEGYHVQSVGPKYMESSSPVYRKWTEQANKFFPDAEFGAIWLTLYPNIMVEIYPGVIVISFVVPHAAEKCTVVTEFFYPEEIAMFEPEFVEAQQAAYFETAKEDDELCYRMHHGRRALFQTGSNELGPYQEPTELGMKHFHEYYLKQLGNVL